MNKKKIIGISLAILLLAAAITVTVMAVTAVRDPKTKVLRAFARLFTEDAGSRLYSKKDSRSGLLFSKYYQTNRDYRKAAEKALKGKFGYGGSLKLEGINADIPELAEAVSYINGIKMKSEGAVDLEEKRVHMSAGLSYAIISLPELTLDVTGSEIALSAESIFNGSLSVDTEGMGTAFNKSELSDIFGLKLDDERVAALDKGVFGEDTVPEEKNDKILKAAVKLYDAMQVDESEEKRNIFIDGKKVACDVYTITVSAEDINSFLGETGVQNVTADGDCTMEAALTPDGNLAYFDLEYGKYVFDLEIRSEECARNDMNIMLAMPGYASFEIICTGSENKDIRQDTVTLNVYRGNHTISCDISAESTMSPETISVDLTDMKLSADGQELALSGGLDLILKPGEIEAAPEPKREILKMSEADFDSLGVEIYDNLMKNDLFAMIFSQFGGEPVISDLLDLMNSGR